MKPRDSFIFSAILSATAVVSLSLEADAASVTVSSCSINSASTEGDGSAVRLKLGVNCDTGGILTVSSYSGFSCTPAGVNKSTMVIEAFKATAQVSIVSGNRVNLKYDNATSGTGCTNGIYSMELVK